MHKINIPLIEIVATTALVAIALTVVFVLFPKIGSAEIAAWVQAIGSIGAILASVFVVTLQQRRERINSKLQVLRKEANLATIAWMYANEFAILLKSINQQVGTAPMVKTSILVNAHARVMNCISRIEALPIWDMGIGEAGLISALKTLADCTANAISVQRLEDEFQPNNFAVALMPFETRATEIADALKMQYDALKRFLYLGSLDDLPKTW